LAAVPGGCRGGARGGGGGGAAGSGAAGPRAAPPRHLSPSQADLAARLAGLLARLPPPTAALYFDCFLATMRREWFAIDYHRLDKFLMLVRRFLAAALGLLRDKRW
jgi:hypothetical protein